MKTINLTFLLVLIIQQISFAQWEEVNISTNSSLSSVHFIDDNNGFVVGGNKVFKTVDGGENWETSFEGSNLLVLEDIYILDENNIISVGRNFDSSLSVVLKSIDNGDNWNLLNLESTSLLHSIYFTSTSTGFCSGSGGAIFKTLDAGDTWQELESGTDESLRSIYFVTDSIGIAVGGSPNSSLMLKTQNGGDDWTPVTTPSDNYFQSAFFTSTQTGYVVGWNGELIKTVDCGSTWITQASVNMTGNLDVFFTDEDTGYIVGGDVDLSSIQKTVNGGDTWEDISPDLMQGLAKIYFTSSNIGYAVGVSGTVLKTESGGVITSTSKVFSNSDISIFPNPAYNSISIETADNAIINLIRIFDNTGKLITQQKENTTIVELDLSEYQSGLFYLELNSENGRAMKKLIKK